MPRLVLLSGLPASGKSTLARKLVDDSGNMVRVNRDTLRQLLFNGKWTGPREGVIKEAERALARVALGKKLSVVIDDTNLRDGNLVSWKQFADINGATFEHMPVDTPLEECLRRDFEDHMDTDFNFRSAVGPAVIYRMAVESGKLKFTKPIVVFDLDGTLCDVKNRLRFIKNCKHCGGSKEGHPTEGTPHASCTNFAKDWDGFFREVRNDPPRIGVVKWAQAIYNSDEYHVVIFSGRNDKTQWDTAEWLDKHGVKYDCLLMRRGSDHRLDTEVKLDMLKMLPRELVAFAVDDRPMMIAAWRSWGVKLYPVTDTNEDY